MKHQILYMLVAVLFATSCNSNTAKASVDQVAQLHIAGVVKNANVPAISIFKEDVVQQIQLGPEKTFDTTFEGYPGYYEIIVGRQRLPIFVTNQGTLNVEVDMRNVYDFSKFEGPGAAESAYLTKKLRVSRRHQSQARKTYAMDEAGFMETVEQQEADLFALMDEHEGLSTEFKDLEKQNISIGSKAFALDYEQAQRFFKEDPEFKTSEAFNARFGHSDFTNEQLFSTIPGYQTMVYRHFIKPQAPEQSIDGIESVESTVIKDALVKQLYNELKPGFKNLDANMGRLMAASTDAELKTALQNKHNQLKTIDTGAKSPGFKYQDINGNMVSLEGMKGKNVYIDVWATWCGPCKREIPHLQKLEEEYHDKNVEFVSISVDTPDKEANWKKMVQDKQMSGTQLITGNGWDSPFVRSYMISGIPRFILLDSEGKIVSSNAPRPSSGNAIRSALNELL